MVPRTHFNTQSTVTVCLGPIYCCLIKTLIRSHLIVSNTRRGIVVHIGAIALKVCVIVVSCFIPQVRGLPNVFQSRGSIHKFA